MNHLTLGLVLVPLIAAAAPPLAALFGRVAKVPLVVFEIFIGILIGPSLLGWVEPTEFLKVLSNLGLAMLFFMAGNEINFRAIKERRLNRAGTAWLISLAVGIVVGILLAPTPAAGVFVGIALASTASGRCCPFCATPENSKPRSAGLSRQSVRSANLVRCWQSHCSSAAATWDPPQWFWSPSS